MEKKNLFMESKKLFDEMYIEMDTKMNGTSFAKFVE